MKRFYLLFSAVILSLAYIPTPMMAVELTEDYLQGAWCFTHSLAGKERSEEMRNYIFDKGGTYSHQTSSMSNRIKGGFTYQILPDTLKLKPEFPGELKIKSLSENQMVLDYFVDLYFMRGECK